MTTCPVLEDNSNLGKLFSQILSYFFPSHAFTSNLGKIHGNLHLNNVIKSLYKVVQSNEHLLSAYNVPKTELVARD